VSPRTLDDLDLLRDAAREVADRGAPKKGGRYTASAYPGGGAVRFGARRFREDDGLSTKAAPGPKGPPTETLIEEAKRRRAEQRAREQAEGRR
jgi:hypothetical protein